MIRWACYIGICFLFLLTACTAQPTNTTTSPLPTATQVITPTPVFTGVIKSPDGLIRAEKVCYQGYMQWVCQAHFPNGNILGGAPGNEWSPDNRYVTVCIGATHDSPCKGYQVWDMSDGKVVGGLPMSPHGWSPNDSHIMLYILDSPLVGTQDQLIAFDPSTGDEKQLDQCPDWFSQVHERACTDFPGVLIGGRVDGLPQNAQASMWTYALDKNMMYGLREINENGPWKGMLRKSFGDHYQITIELEGYRSTPVSYTVYLSGTQAYLASGGQITTVEANSINFTFEK